MQNKCTVVTCTYATQDGAHRSKSIQSPSKIYDDVQVDVEIASNELVVYYWKWYNLQDWGVAERFLCFFLKASAEVAAFKKFEHPF